MYTLYARPGSGSAAVEALLHEIGETFTIIDIPRGTPSPDYLAINPTGQIPSLRLPDDSVMTESAAMMIYLADKYVSAGLAPDIHSPFRTIYLRWMLFFASTVYMADLRYFYPARHSIDPSHAEGIKARADEHMTRDFAIFANGLGEGPFVLGKQFSAVDIYIAMLISWAPDTQAVFKNHPNIEQFYRAVAGRTKITPVWVRNEFPL